MLVSTTQPSASSQILADDLIPISQIRKTNKGESLVICCKIQKFENRHGWYFDACGKCANKLLDDGGAVKCPKCNKVPDSTQPKLKLLYSMKDDSGSCPVTFWDQQASQLLGKTTPKLKLLLNEDNDMYEFPDELESVVWKKLLVKLKRNDYNITHPHSSISALEFSVCQDLLPHYNNVSSEVQQDTLTLSQTKVSGESSQTGQVSLSDDAKDVTPGVDEVVTLRSNSDDIPIAQLSSKGRGKRRITSKPSSSDASRFPNRQTSNNSPPRIHKNIK